MKGYINDLKDYAELAQASYFNFEFMGNRKIYELDSQGNKIKDEKYPRGYKEVEITLEHIINKKYQGQEVLINLKQDNTWQSNLLNSLDEKFNSDKLNGEFGEIQAKNFLKKYDVLIHQPNTHSGFSATLFGEKRKQTNTQTKEVTYTNEGGYIHYILAIRGTETDNIKDYFADKNLLFKDTPKEQYFDMLLFYNQCIGKIPFYVESDSIPQDRNSLEYEIWKVLYLRSTQSEYKPYIAESLLKDSTLPPTSLNFTSPITATTKLTLTGHSLGGCLAQLFCICNKKYSKTQRIAI